MWFWWDGFFRLVIALYLAPWRLMRGARRGSLLRLEHIHQHFEDCISNKWLHRERWVLCSDREFFAILTRGDCSDGPPSDGLLHRKTTYRIL